MNFLSHYYFDKNNTNNYEVLGSILPDLLKNANKTYNIYPEKKESLFSGYIEKSILNGWKKHLLVDKIFHNTSFFFFHQHQLKLELRNIIKDSPVKPFFLGHITLELILDHLLIIENKIKVDKLYEHLQSVSNENIQTFLEKNGIEYTDKFFLFFERFKKEQYLNSYVDVKNITYSLKRICMRVWDNPFNAKQEEEITEIISLYISKLREEFILIFEEIESQLDK